MSDTAAQKSKKPVPPTVTVAVTLTVDEGWIDFLDHSDIFGRDYCGYWLRGVEHVKKRGWLVWEEGASDESARFGEEPNRAEALAAWRAGGPLPKGWSDCPDCCGSGRVEATCEDCGVTLTEANAAPGSDSLCAKCEKEAESD